MHIFIEIHSAVEAIWAVPIGKTLNQSGKLGAIQLCLKYTVTFPEKFLSKFLVGLGYIVGIDTMDQL